MAMLQRLWVWMLNTRLVQRGLARFLRPAGVFLCYPARQAFADRFASRRRQEAHAWEPCLVGVARHGRRFLLVFAVSSAESVLTDSANAPRLAALSRAMVALAARFGATHIGHAGRLGSILRAGRQIGPGAGEEAPVQAVLQAVARVVRARSRPFDAVVVLGGRGHLGRRLVRALAGSPEAAGAPVVAADRHDPVPMGGEVLYLNCSVAGVLDAMAHRLPASAVVINEVYPAPQRYTRRVLDQRGVALLHVAGIAGRAWPAFPGEYAGALPCCAAQPGEAVEGVLVALNEHGRRCLEDSRCSAERLQSAKMRAASCTN